MGNDISSSESHLLIMGQFLIISGSIHLILHSVGPDPHPLDALPPLDTVARGHHVPGVDQHATAGPDREAEDKRQLMFAKSYHTGQPHR